MRGSAGADKFSLAARGNKMDLLSKKKNLREGVEEGEEKSQGPPQPCAQKELIVGDCRTVFAANQDIKANQSETAQNQNTKDNETENNPKTEVTQTSAPVVGAPPSKKERSAGEKWRRMEVFERRAKAKRLVQNVAAAKDPDSYTSAMTEMLKETQNPPLSYWTRLMLSPVGPCETPYTKKRAILASQLASENQVYKMLLNREIYDEKRDDKTAEQRERERQLRFELADVPEWAVADTWPPPERQPARAPPVAAASGTTATLSAPSPRTRRKRHRLKMRKRQNEIAAWRDKAKYLVTKLAAARGTPNFKDAMTEMLKETQLTPMPFWKTIMADSNDLKPSQYMNEQIHLNGLFTVQRRVYDMIARKTRMEQKRLRKLMQTPEDSDALLQNKVRRLEEEMKAVPQADLPEWTVVDVWPPAENEAALSLPSPAENEAALSLPSTSVPCTAPSGAPVAGARPTSSPGTSGQIPPQSLTASAHGTAAPCKQELTLRAVKTDHGLKQDPSSTVGAAVPAPTTASSNEVLAPGPEKTNLGLPSQPTPSLTSSVDVVDSPPTAAPSKQVPAPEMEKASEALPQRILRSAHRHVPPSQAASDASVSVQGDTPPSAVSKPSAPKLVPVPVVEKTSEGMPQRTLRSAARAKMVPPSKALVGSDSLAPEVSHFPPDKPVALPAVDKTKEQVPTESPTPVGTLPVSAPQPLKQMTPAAKGPTSGPQVPPISTQNKDTANESILKTEKVLQDDLTGSRGNSEIDKTQAVDVKESKTPQTGDKNECSKLFAGCDVGTSAIVKQNDDLLTVKVKQTDSNQTGHSAVVAGVQSMEKALVGSNVAIGKRRELLQREREVFERKAKARYLVANLKAARGTKNFKEAMLEMLVETQSPPLPFWKKVMVNPVRDSSTEFREKQLDLEKQFCSEDEVCKMLTRKAKNKRRSVRKALRLPEALTQKREKRREKLEAKSETLMKAVIPQWAILDTWPPGERQAAEMPPPADVKRKPAVPPSTDVKPLPSPAVPKQNPPVASPATPKQNPPAVVAKEMSGQPPKSAQQTPDSSAHRKLLPTTAPTVAKGLAAQQPSAAAQPAPSSATHSQKPTLTGQKRRAPQQSTNAGSSSSPQTANKRMQKQPQGGNQPGNPPFGVTGVRKPKKLRQRDRVRAQKYLQGSSVPHPTNTVDSRITANRHSGSPARKNRWPPNLYSRRSPERPVWSSGYSSPDRQVLLDRWSQAVQEMRDMDALERNQLGFPVSPDRTMNLSDLHRLQERVELDNFRESREQFNLDNLRRSPERFGLENFHRSPELIDLTHFRSSPEHFSLENFSRSPPCVTLDNFDRSPARDTLDTFRRTPDRASLSGFSREPDNFYRSQQRYNLDNIRRSQERHNLDNIRRSQERLNLDNIRRSQERHTLDNIRRSPVRRDVDNFRRLADHFKKTTRSSRSPRKSPKRRHRNSPRRSPNPLRRTEFRRSQEEEARRTSNPAAQLPVPALTTLPVPDPAPVPPPDPFFSHLTNVPSFPLGGFGALPGPHPLPDFPFFSMAMPGMPPDVSAFTAGGLGGPFLGPGPVTNVPVLPMFGQNQPLNVPQQFGIPGAWPPLGVTQSNTQRPAEAPAINATSVSHGQLSDRREDIRKSDSNRRGEKRSRRDDEGNKSKRSRWDDDRDRRGRRGRSSDRRDDGGKGRQPEKRISPQARQRGNQREEAKEQRVSVVIVTHALFPAQWLTEELARNVQTDLLLAITREVDGRGPRFEGITFRDGCLRIRCQPESVPWLENQIHRVGFLKILSSHSCVKAVASLKTISMGDEKTILNTLKAQNQNLHTELWEVLDMRETPDGHELFLEIDQLSADHLKKIDMEPFFGFGRAQFRLCSGRDPPWKKQPSSSSSRHQFK